MRHLLEDTPTLMEDIMEILYEESRRIRAAADIRAELRQFEEHLAFLTAERSETIHPEFRTIQPRALRQDATGNLQILRWVDSLGPHIPGS